MKSKEQLQNSIKKTDFLLLYELFFPTKIRWRLIMIILMVYCVFHLCILKENIDILNFWKALLNNVQSIEISVLAFLITGYAIFQAFLDENTLKKMLQNQKNETIYFVRINKYFYFLTLFFFIIILFNAVVLSIIDKDVVYKIISLFPIIKNKFVLLLCTTIYFGVHLLLLFDVKSFLKNIHDIFVINANYRDEADNK
ncbi:hypothetical protein [Fusobacterium necrophorum]|uniref:hypothetical protein n=1 Tax=Fusobacterium necrophorum TaxID=859 RepID=UPI00370E017B